MTEKSPKEQINKLRFDDCITSEVNSFDSRKHLFDIGLDSDMSLNENKAIPSLKEVYHQSQSGLHIDLGFGMDEAIENNKFVTNYDNILKQSWIHLLRCLQKNKTIAEEEPTFVTFTPIISDLFAIEWDSTFFALRFKGVIYLFRNESLQMVYDLEEELKPHSFYMLRFLYLISDRNDSDINGFERNMRVDSIQLNENKLIVCYGIPANDRNGSPIHAKCRQIFQRYIDQELKHRLLFDWSHCALSGVPTYVLGRRYRSTLEEVQFIDADTIPHKCRDYWTPQKCFSFVEQSLKFIKSCVDSELELFEFKINSEDKTLSCFRHETTDTSAHILPEFYIKS